LEEGISINFVGIGGCFCSGLMAPHRLGQLPPGEAGRHLAFSWIAPCQFYQDLDVSFLLLTDNCWGKAPARRGSRDTPSCFGSKRFLVVNQRLRN